MTPKVIKNVELNYKLLNKDPEYLDYYTEDEDLTSAANYNGRSLTFVERKNGQSKVK